MLLPRIQRNTLLFTLFLPLLLQYSNAQVELPDFGNSADRLTTEQQEYEVGLKMLRQMRTYDMVVEDALIQEYLDNLAFSLVENSDANELKFTFFMVDNRQVNAFAAPGGFIGVNAGLVLTAQDESEVAAVLAHEIAHISQRHMVRYFESARKATLPIALAMIGALVAAGGDGDVASAALIGGSGLMQQASINFTRHNEYEADRIGIRTLSRAGHDPMAMAVFFGRMGKLSRNYGELPPEFLRTHPVSTTRVAEAKSRARGLPAAESRETLPFRLLRERARVLTQPDEQHSLAYYRDLMAEPETENDPAFHYGRALTLRQIGKTGESLEIARKLLHSDPHRREYELLVAETEVMAGDLDNAIAAYQQLRETFPGNLPVEISYCEALLQMEQPKYWLSARDIVRSQLIEHAELPQLYELLARAEDLLGDTVGATEAVAQNYHLHGRTYEAIQQLRGLARDQNLDYYDQARVNARLVELEKQLPKSEQKQLTRNEKPPR